jgi:hypothetical protein
VIAALADLRGRRVRGVRRIHYTHAGEVERANGALELTLDDGRVLLLDAGPDGEALVARGGPWVDPFAPPLSPENADFVATSGKWSAFEPEPDDPLHSAIGQQVQDVEVATLPQGKPVGVRLTLDRLRVFADVQADELLVRTEAG